ncbi:SCP2 sterol-binding domain-containing protein [Deinococcus alpinitundrae]|uniref:SCP2 sterol-binding domain-containing protein n=1 Tax=Deinococcus alpinitundrae TaxID=468913 RepID=UPI001379F53C|nr:SCP2 sterol-binding domain-containing protein [Deinococcus alpinitundrae]
MSPSTSSAAQLKAVLSEVYAPAGQDAQAGVLAARRLVVAFAFRNPDLHLVVDGRSGEAVVRTGGDDLPAADLTFHLAGDDIDQFWRGDLNPVAALSAGQLKIEGSLLTALVLAPALPGLQARYRQITARLSDDAER